MSDLTNLGAWCAAKAVEHDRPEDERRLWTQIADEISDYLGPDEAPAEPGLFDREPL